LLQRLKGSFSGDARAKDLTAPLRTSKEMLHITDTFSSAGLQLFGLYKYTADIDEYVDGDEVFEMKK
jgi:hypothetical protein